MIREIHLTDGAAALLDSDDYERLVGFCWRVKSFKGKAYAVRNDGRKMIFMHREVLCLKHGDGFISDHINGNGLDNRKTNLRRCTHAENMRNRRKISSASSQYKGVSWNKRECKWEVNIYADNQRISLGRYEDEVMAAETYDSAAMHYHGMFAALNFPGSTIYKGKPS